MIDRLASEIAALRKRVAYLESRESGLAIVRLAPPVVLAVDAPLITFSSIPQTYRNVLWRLTGRSTYAAAEDYVYQRFNSDATAGNYWYINHFSYGGATPGSNAATDSKVYSGTIAAANAPANTAGHVYAEIFDYARTVWNKNVRAQSGTREGIATTAFMGDTTSGGWISTAAITRVDLLLFGGSFKAGTAVELFGVP